MKDLQKRIAELEREVAELKARPYIYVYSSPPVPTYPSPGTAPWQPAPTYPQITCSAYNTV